MIEITRTCSQISFWKAYIAFQKKKNKLNHQKVNLTFVVDAALFLCLTCRGVRMGVALAGVRTPLNAGVRLLPPNRPGVREATGVPAAEDVPPPGNLFRVGRIFNVIQICFN